TRSRRLRRSASRGPLRNFAEAASPAWREAISRPRNACNHRENVTMNKVLGCEENQPTRALLPWFQGWNVLAVAIGVVAMTMGIAHTSFSFFALEWMAEFGSSRGETMLVLAATQIMAGIFLPFSGRAMDRLSVRWVGLIGVILLACGLALASLATSLWQIGLVYGLILAA